MELSNKEKFDIEEFKKLSYEEAKEVFNIVKFNLDYSGQRKEVERVLKQIKENTFKILKVAHYYPVINKLDYLSDELKNAVDSFLCKLRVGGYIHTGSRGWWNLELTKEMETRLLNDLYDLGVVERCYELSCFICGDTIKVLTEKEYLDHKKMFEIFCKQREKKATEEELEWCEKLMDTGGRVWEISCMHCDDEYQEVENFEQLNSRAGVLYKVKKEPDLTYANK